MTTEQKYQFFPPLAAHEYAALKADIKENGVKVAIEYDSQGNVLDGYHRLKICEELKIFDFPSVIRVDLSEAEKVDHVFKLNMARRHLSSEQKRSILSALIKASPEKSNRQIGSMIGAHHVTVGSVRRKMEEAGEVAKLSVSIGADGKKYKRNEKPKPKGAVFKDTARSLALALRKGQEILEAADSDPERYGDLVDQVAATGRVHGPHVEMKKRQRQAETEEKAKKAKTSTEHRVIWGHSMDMIPDETMSLICTDPPYNISHDRVVEFADDSRQGYDRDMGEWDHVEKVDFYYKMLEWSHGFFRVLKPGGSVYTFCSEAHISQFRECLIMAGFRFKNVLTWHFTNPRPTPEKTSWITAADHILFAVKGPGHTFHWTAVPLMHSVLRFGVCQGAERRDHPTQKPIKLIEKLISTSSDPGDVVLDPFAGSGTTGEACQNLDRSFILIEAVKEYIHMIEERTGVKHEKEHQG